MPERGWSKSGFLLLSLLVLILDQWSKWLVEKNLPEHLPKEVIPGVLNFTHVTNTGVAFGLFASNGSVAGTVLLTVLGLIALAIVGIYFWRTPSHDRLMLTSLSLILGGAIGNLADRVATGAVTDFIDAYIGTYHWHTFNIADSAITIGICLMALDILFADRRRGSEADSAAAANRS